MGLVPPEGVNSLLQLLPVPTAQGTASCRGAGLAAPPGPRNIGVGKKSPTVACRVRGPSGHALSPSAPQGEPHEGCHPVPGAGAHFVLSLIY